MLGSMHVTLLQHLLFSSLHDIASEVGLLLLLKFLFLFLFVPLQYKLCEPVKFKTMMMMTMTMDKLSNIECPHKGFTSLISPISFHSIPSRSKIHAIGVAQLYEYVAIVSHQSLSSHTLYLV
jgi:hypothetical protein